MTTHILKTWPEYFQAVRSGHKTVELRRDDRPYATGDALHLREYDPMQPGYTGEYEYVRVTHVLRGGEWLAPGYVALSIRLMGEDGRARVQEDFRASYDAEREAHEDTKRALALLKDRFEQEQAKIAGLNQEIYTLQSIAAAAQQYNERPYSVENGALRIKLDQAVQAYGEWLRHTRVSLQTGLEETQVNGQEPPSLLAAARASEDVAFVDAALLRVLERATNNQE